MFGMLSSSLEEVYNHGQTLEHGEKHMKKTLEFKGPYISTENIRLEKVHIPFVSTLAIILATPSGCTFLGLLSWGIRLESGRNDV
jgi:hypothetical protein